MQNYEESGDGRSRLWAWLVTASYALVVGVSMLFVSFDFGRHRSNNADVIYVELPPEEPVVRPDPPKRVAEAPRHERVTQTDNSREVSGKEEQTRTVNPRALFKMSKSGTDAPENAGNPYAREAEEDSAKGTGGGLNPTGNEFLDEGLLGRGLVGALPRPEYPAGNRGGKVVIRVTVDRSGSVTDAVYEPKGSTTSDSALVEAALKAARRAKFTESAAFVQGGTITYVFRMK